MISTISVILAVAVAVGFNGILNKLFIGNCSTKVKTAVGITVDALVGALIGYTSTGKVLAAVTNAIVAVAVSDLSYDYIFKTLKSVMDRMSSFKKITDKTETVKSEEEK